jgi:hypothetical protein
MVKTTPPNKIKTELSHLVAAKIRTQQTTKTNTAITESQTLFSRRILKVFEKTFFFQPQDFPHKASVPQLVDTTRRPKV